jgi:hypothetical protein
MKRVPRALALASLVPALLAALPASGAKEAGAPPCVLYRAEARYGAVGYNHVVVLRNACGAAHVCTVSTDVNPTPTITTVPPHQQVEVVTFLGSPASVFVPRVDCQPVR